MKYIALVVWGVENLALYNLTDKTYEVLQPDDMEFRSAGRHFHTLKGLKDLQDRKGEIGFNQAHVPEIIQVWKE